MKQNPIIGSMEVQTDSSGMKATLRFVPAGGGKAWTLEALKGFLKKEKIVHGYTSQSLKTTLKQLGDAVGDVRSAVVAEATLPPNSETEKPEWKDCPIPPDLEEDALAFFAQLEKPRIYSTRYEEVLPQKANAAKRFFLLPKKQEKQVKKKVRKLIGVDPRVLGEGWVEQGMVLATMPPGITGKEGSSVFGHPIPAEKTGKTFYLGAGVERTGNNLKATVKGFLRRGENWVEVLPFQPHQWTVSLSKDKNTFLLNFQPGTKHATPPPPELILQEAKKKGAPKDSLLSAYELGTLLQNSIDEGKGLSEVSISSDADGGFIIRVSKDKLKVILSMKKSRGGGKPLVLKDFGRALKGGNYFQPNYAKIQEDVLAFYRGPEKELTDYILVEGIPPEAPGDVSVRVALKYLGDDEVKAIKNREEENSFDPQWIVRMREEIPSLEKHPLSQVERMALVTKEAVIAEVSWKPGKPGKDVFGKTIPSGEVGNTGVNLFEGLTRKGRQVITSREGIVDQWGGLKNPSLRVRPHRDCFVGIVLAANRMSAALSLRCGTGTGRLLTVERVKEACKEKGIQRGVDKKVLAQAMEQAVQGQKVEDVVFANGRPPLKNSPESLELLAPFETIANADVQTPLTLVEKDTPLARINRTAQGSPEGWDVTGKTIPALKNAQPVELTIGENIREETDEEGNSLFYADKPGKLIREKDQISVASVHTIAGDVDESRGNVKFPGTVKVNGRVRSNCYVMAEEDIHIEGKVEAALLSAGNSVFVRREIIGEGKGVVRARETICAASAEKCTLFAVGDIILSRDCIGCSVSTNGRLVLQGRESSIYGGKIQAKGGLETFNLGSEKGAPTAVSFGQDYLIKNRIGAEEREIQKAKSALARIDKKLNQTKEQEASAMMKNLHAEKVKLMKLIKKRSIRALVLQEKFEEHYSGEIKVRGAVYPGVVLEAHGRTLEIERKQKNITFRFDEKTGHIVTKENL